MSSSRTPVTTRRARQPRRRRSWHRKVFVVFVWLLLFTGSGVAAAYWTVSGSGSGSGTGGSGGTAKAATAVSVNITNDTSQNADGSLRTSGTLLANVFTLLRDSGKATPGALDYSMSTASGLPVVDDHQIETDEVHHTLLHSSDGSFWLALWVDDDPQDGENGTQQVTLDLKTPVTSVTPYTPLDGLTAGTALTGQKVTVTVPDHPLLLKIQPKG